MVGAGREMKLLGGGLEQFLARGIEFAEIAHLGWSHFGVTGQSGTAQALELALTRCLHARANRRGVFSLTLVGELLVIDARNLDVNVDAIQQWPADTLLVTRNGLSRTTSF